MPRSLQTNRKMEEATESVAEQVTIRVVALCQKQDAHCDHTKAGAPVL
jgi:hypothetical protein